LTASQYLREHLGGKIGISERIGEVQAAFAGVFNEDPKALKSEADFDLYFKDGEELPLGKTIIRIMATPGHTPACLTYLWEDAAFVGDSIFMPDSGTARCDFPGGDAATLYASIRKILTLPDATTLYMCHDYGAGGKRDAAWVTTVAEQKESNIHVGGGTLEADYIEMRQTRDATLSMPGLILPSVQINMRAGHFPKAEDNGLCYLKLPLNAF
jgi:glyoxylase-like metal-dependent hydrolase (beta-lactamase superfamily II)